MGEKTFDEWLDSVEPDPADARDASHIRRIIAAAEALDAAHEELRDAVAEARAAGDTWDAIGVALGTSRQAAYQRFGGKLEPPVGRGSRRVSAVVRDRPQPKIPAKVTKGSPRARGGSASRIR